MRPLRGRTVKFSPKQRQFGFFQNPKLPEIWDLARKTENLTALPSRELCWVGNLSIPGSVVEVGRGPVPGVLKKPAGL